MTGRIVVAVASLALMVGSASVLGPTGAGAVSTTEVSAAGGTGVGDPYFPLDGNAGYDVRHYDIRVALAMASGRLRGTTTLTARATADLASFHLDFMLGVRDVRVNGRKAVWRRPHRHELRVVPSVPIAAGDTFTVRVGYAGYPSRPTYLGTQPWHGNSREVVAVNEPHIAPWWFPANDHPSDKARYDIRVRARNDLQVIANGLRVSRRVGERSTVHHWRAVDPMTTYLAFFAVGRFDVERGRTGAGVPYVLAVSRRLSPESRVASMRLLRRTPRVQRWMERRLGEYPFRSTGGLVTSLRTGFALETQTRPVYEQWTPPWVVAHELAHQWFGNSVSLESWSDIWLNEGLATYLERRWEVRGSARPEVAMRRWLAAVIDDYPASFWDLPIGDPGPHHLFAEEVYERGAMAVQALRHRIGGPAFNTVLRGWVRERRGGHGTISDFRALAERVSGQDLGPFFRAWLYDGRRPACTRDNGLDSRWC